MKRTKIVNGQVITPYRILSDGVVEIQEGKIDYVGERGSGLPCEEEIDARGNFVWLRAHSTNLSIGQFCCA